MGQLGPLLRQHDADHVETAIGLANPFFRHIGHSRPQQMSSFPAIHPTLRWAEGTTFRRLNLYEDKRLSLSGNNINLSISGAVVSFQDNISLAPKICYGYILPPFTQF